jgi:hypothetical protein
MRRAIVVLDDIDRARELQVLGAWERECSMRFKIPAGEPDRVGRRA